MIASKDRSMWFGASDTSYVVGNRETESWQKWWRQKLGINKDSFETAAMQVGTHLEHRILTYIGIPEMDKQILIPDLHLRVNYDGTGEHRIVEVKTYSKDEFKVSKQYWRQAQVEMFAWLEEYGVLPELTIAAYHVTDHDYDNFFVPIDPQRLSYHPVEYDAKWVEKEYIPKLSELGKALEEGVMP